MYYAHDNGRFVEFVPVDSSTNCEGIVSTPYIIVNVEKHREYFQGKWNRIIDGQPVYVPPPEPTREETIEKQIAALDDEYNPQFDALTLAWATASMEGDTETANARKADKDALKLEYQQKREVILNGG